MVLQELALINTGTWKPILPVALVWTEEQFHADAHFSLHYSPELRHAHGRTYIWWHLTHCSTICVNWAQKANTNILNFQNIVHI